MIFSPASFHTPDHLPHHVGMKLIDGQERRAATIHRTDLKGLANWHLGAYQEDAMCVEDGSHGDACRAVRRLEGTAVICLSCRQAASLECGPMTACNRGR